MIDYIKFWIAKEIATLGIILGFVALLGLIFLGILAAVYIQAAYKWLKSKIVGS